MNIKHGTQVLTHIDPVLDEQHDKKIHRFGIMPSILRIRSIQAVTDTELFKKPTKN